MSLDHTYDVVVVGAGAAGLATAIFARRENPTLRVAVLDGARRPGAKILVSGGSRCNVTNTVVSASDFRGGSPTPIRHVLRGFSVEATVEFFLEMGVRLREEPGGKLFPDSNRSRDVLEALLRELSRTGASLLPGHRVTSIDVDDGSFVLSTSYSAFHAGAVVLATGGLSLPKTGSDGAGYQFARALGHTIVPTTPALVPLVLADEPDAIHRRLTGVSHDVALDIRVDGARIAAVSGAMLWTHFGISGPAALDASRFWLRARLEGREPVVTARLCGGQTYETLDRRWMELATERPRASLQAALATMLPSAVAGAVLDRRRLNADTTLAHLTRDDRRRLVRALAEWPLAVRDSRGYNHAEVTAGGVPLQEVEVGTMESRVCPRLYLVGEILDVDGRIGGFNFQWAWSTAHLAGRAIGRRFGSTPPR